MLTINGVSIQLKKEGFRLLENLHVIVNANDKYAIIGHEGTGKSTLLKAIYNPDLLPYADVFGVCESRGNIGYLEQDIAQVWSGVNVQDFFVKKTPDSEVDYAMYERLKMLPQALERVGFSVNSYDDFKNIDDFSGGEIVKLGIVKLLLQDTEVFLLDEPSNDLDFETILFLEQFMQEEKRPIVFVSHDERLLENVATGVIHLQRTEKMTKTKHYIEKMPYLQYKEHRMKVYESSLQVALKQRADYKQKMARWRQVYQRVEHQQNQVVRDPSQARLLKKKVKSMQGQLKRFEKEKAAFVDIPEAEERIDIFFDAAVSLPQGKRVIDIHLPELKIKDRVLSENIDLVVVGQSKVVITGKNGSGKTTLLNALYRKLKDRDDISVGYMTQHYDSLFEGKTILQFLQADKDRKKEAWVRKMLGALGFEREEMTRDTKNLSGGQRAKLYFLKLILDKNNVLLLDEPTRNLSPLSAPEIHRMLSDFKGCIVCVTHDRVFIERVFDKMYALTKSGLKEL